MSNPAFVPAPVPAALAARAAQLSAAARAAGFARCARYISACSNGVNFVAPFVPCAAFAEWVVSAGGEYSSELGIAWWA